MDWVGGRSPGLTASAQGTFGSPRARAPEPAPRTPREETGYSGQNPIGSRLPDGITQAGNRDYGTGDRADGRPPSPTEQSLLVCI